MIFLKVLRFPQTATGNLVRADPFGGVYCGQHGRTELLPMSTALKNGRGGPTGWRLPSRSPNANRIKGKITTLPSTIPLRAICNRTSWKNGVATDLVQACPQAHRRRSVTPRHRAGPLVAGLQAHQLCCLNGRSETRPHLPQSADREQLESMQHQK